VVVRGRAACSRVQGHGAIVTRVAAAAHADLWLLDVCGFDMTGWLSLSLSQLQPTCRCALLLYTVLQINDQQLSPILPCHLASYVYIRSCAQLAQHCLTGLLEHVGKHLLDVLVDFSGWAGLSL
jgi:hypothetical protein